MSDDEIIDILEDGMPKAWEDEMQCQKYNYAAEGQIKFISFCGNLQSMDPPKGHQGKRQ